jgi:hypothetical protein
VEFSQDSTALRDSPVRAQFAPDTRRSSPDDAARLALVLDNHDSTTRRVRVELSGPLARYTRPRRLARLDLSPGRQQEITLEVRPEDAGPEGGHTYELVAVVVDERTDQIVFACSARIGVERYPNVTSRPERATPYSVTNQNVVMLRVHVRNSGNVPILVDARKINTQHWVRDDDRRRVEKMNAARRAVQSERAAPRTPERLRPRQTHDFEIAAEPPPYPVGIGPRRWWVPVGVLGEDIDAQCVFVDFQQRPRVEVERRVVYLAIAVGAALLVLAVFMGILAS